MKRYTPRRAGKKWLKGSPVYVLDCFDSRGNGERYTVLFCGDYLITDGTFAGTFIPGLGMSGAPSHPQGVSQRFELRAYHAAAYRYRENKHRVKWETLPASIRAHVIARAETN